MPASKSKSSQVNPYPPWAPRFWHGMLLSDWLRLLSKNHFRIHPLRWGLAGTVTCMTVFNSKMRLAQNALMGHRIANTPVPDDPIFILGHWRSGTTFLHELMSVDERFATPTTFQCFAANHFLLTETVLTRLFWFLIPSRRPMDNVAAGWHAPQEDEFALCSMGLPSPYLRIAFPNTAEEFLNYLDMEGLAPEAVEQWQEGLREFMRRMMLRSGKRLVLKSPTHTGRLGLLAEMFPQAKFVHIVRNPYDIVPSTIRLWRSLDEAQALRLAQQEELEDYIFRAYDHMYGGFLKHRDQLPADRLIEIRYEDLVQDQLGTLEKVYTQLEFDGFATVRPALEQRLAGQREYRTNTHTLDNALLEKINARWKDYFDAYGYEMKQPAATGEVG